MKTILFVFLFVSCTKVLFSQEMAVTERGDTVLLYSTGEWVYLDNFLHTKDEHFDIEFNEDAFQTPKDSKRVVKGFNNAYSIAYNDKLWSRIPAGQLNPEADIAFKLMKGDIYSMVIYEELQIEIESLYEIAYNNAAGMMSDFKMIDKDYRVVNSDTLIWMRMDGTTQGMKIAYLSYYLSNENGSVQFHTFTGQNLVDKYETKIFDLLNGIKMNDN